MGDQSDNLKERGSLADNCPSITATPPAPGHPPALVGKRAADPQVPPHDYNPAPYPPQTNEAGYHMQSQYNQPNPYGIARIRQALPDYATQAPYGFQQYPNQPPPAVYQNQYPQNASYGPPVAYGAPYPPQYAQRSPVAGQFDQNVYQYYQDAYGWPPGSPTAYMQQMPQFHQPQAVPRSSASGQQHGTRDLLAGPADGKHSWLHCNVPNNLDRNSWLHPSRPT
jgi:hypothetical protein